MESISWDLGMIYRGFRVERSVWLEELRVQLIELVHLPTGAQVMHLVNDDPENTFCLAFQTRPEKSNGVAHILEHTVLCGSKKYPVKDPFFAMTRRSLNTFMNALTGADCTYYPAASQVPSDFYNLLDVYLDAVFHAKLELLSFLQEGHRLEFSGLNLEYKGIVYNEMKGDMASPMSRLFEQVNPLLYPDVTYGINSGGLPKEIPSLTYDQLKEFYQRYYHPSRCLFYFYGNLPTQRHLDYIAEAILEKTEPAPPLEPLPRQKRYKTAKERIAYYPSEPNDMPEANTIATVAWLTCDLADQELLLALSMLSVILMDTDASPLKRALLDSGLCKQASLYLDSDNADVPLYLICRGCDQSKVPALAHLILESLKTIAAQGIDPSALENALHQLELHRSEITGSQSPYGLTLFNRAGIAKQKGVSPERALLVHSLCDELRKKIAQEPRYLERILTEQLINNGHRVTVTLVPDPQLTRKEQEEETETLRQLQERLSKEELHQIALQAKELETFQQQQEEQDSSLLPLLAIEEIPHQSRDYLLTTYADGPLELFHHSCFTNQITYIDYALPLPAIDVEELPHLNLLANLYGQLGCGGLTFNKTLESIQAYTGGIYASPSLYYHTSHLGKLSADFSLRGKALDRNLGKLCELLCAMARGIDFSDQMRIKELILKQWSGLQSNFVQRAMRYASNLAASTLSTAGRISYSWSGLGYYYAIKEIAENIETQLPILIKKLEELQQRVFHGNHAQIIVACDDKAFEKLQQANYYGLADLSQRPYTPWKADYSIPTLSRQGRIINAPVAYTSQVLHSPPYTHPENAALRVAAMLMESLHLHPTIREQGGAYGGGASCNPMTGHFAFYSYRDPNLSSTLKAFKEAVQLIADGDFDSEELYEAKLEMFQDLDGPIAPGDRADCAYTWWREAKPLKMRQTFRNQLFNLTQEDVVKAVQKHLLPQLDESIIVTFANQELLMRENALLTKPLEILHV